jgi:hypothetical protein
MATSGTYFLNGPTLSSATAVFTDAALSTCAPDGFYSDGTIVREQVSCSLLPEVTCPSCATPCDTNITGTGGQGVYYIDLNTGSDTGAIVLRFSPFSIPDGILAQLGSNYYNGMSSQYYGWLQGSAGLPTYVGRTADDCGLVSGSPHVSIPEYEYEVSGFVSLGTDAIVNVLAGQLALTTNNPGVCTMVIPKTSNTYTVLNTEIIGLCALTGFQIDIDCPVELSSWMGSPTAATSNTACLSTPTQTYYYVHVNGSGGVLGLYDMVFSDPNGEFPLAAGYYNTGAMSASYNWIQVDANGVVISFGVCVEGTNYTVQRCYTSDTEVVTLFGTPSPTQNITLVEHPGCIWEVVGTTVSPATATLLSVTTDTCASQCSSWEIENTNPSPTLFTYTGCDGVSVSFELGAGKTVTLCAREITSVPSGINVSVIDCDCEFIPGVWELLGCCNDDTIYAVPSVGVSVGNLVKVSDTDLTDCWYEAIALLSPLTYGPTTTIIANNFGEFNCSEVCCSYTIENVDSVANDVSFIECGGTPTIINIPAGNSVNICARSGSITTTGTMNVIFVECNC